MEVLGEKQVSQVRVSTVEASHQQTINTPTTVPGKIPYATHLCLVPCFGTLSPAEVGERECVVGKVDHSAQLRLTQKVWEWG